MTKKKRSILLAVMTVMLCLALVAGGTYALFTDSVTLGNHLVAGTLDITLIRTKLTTTSLNTTTGFLDRDVVNDEDIDFSEPWDPNKPELKNENVFDLTDGMLIVPGCSYSADMKLINNTDVAFGYWIEIDYDETIDKTLADQVVITVTTADQTKSISKKLSESKGEIGADDDVIEVIAKTGSGLQSEAEFNITITFVDDDDINNDAKSKEFHFDIIVHAVQATDAPATGNP